MQAVALASLAWIAVWNPGWAPAVVASALGLQCLAHRGGAADPWASAVIVLSMVVFLALHGGWEVTVGWVLLAALAAAVGRSLPRRDRSRPDAADFLAVGGWGVVFILAPRLVGVEFGGWLAPGVLLYAALRLGRTRIDIIEKETLGPPSREVRGTVSVTSVVIAGPDELPRSVPIDLELRAGDSVAVLCDAPDEATSLAEVLAGRRAPHSGEISIDGAPMNVGERLVAVVAPGEDLVPGDLLGNLSILSEDRLDRGAVAALHDACSLNEVTEALRGRRLTGDGTPLSPYHKLLVLAARVIPSPYRVLVVVDPMPWVNAVRGELWRSAVVRASVGRTSIWITSDRDLAARASLVLEYRQGALRPFQPPVVSSQ
jgi:predicted ABC-type transport system involved in lysophospholipase L1 biosynthesis ATPase subunit